MDYAGEQTEENTYNEIGLLTTVTTAEGVTEYQYDDASRLISVTQPGGDTVSYTYDGHGNRLSMTYPNGKTVTYAYDEMDRLVSVNGADGVTTTYEYDALGRRTKTAGGKEITEYTYDEVGDLIAQTTTGAYDLALEYTYDLSGRMTGESRTENGATVESAYTYDALGQLTDYTRSGGISEGYTYDAVGNMLTKTQSGVKTEYTYNAANQLTQSVTGGNTTAYTYDPNGNLTAKQTATGTTRYTYNALNLLQSYTGEDGYTETYTYNANRLLSSVTTPEATTSLTWDILYGDGVVISETTGKNTTDYTYGLDRISAITGSNRAEYIYDARGSVAAEVSYNNAWYTFGGTLGWKNVTSKSYTPFGEQIGEKTSGFGYNGEYYNAVTGQIYLRARFYEPEMNRFSQKDVLRGNIISGTSLNRYLYCQNDPVNYADYNGHRAVAVDVSMHGGSYYAGVLHQSQIKQATKLVNEAKQYMREAEAAYQRAQAYAPSSQLAKDAMTQWKSAKKAAARAGINLTLLKKATNSFAAKRYLENIRTARNSASQAATAALTLADRAGRNRVSNSAINQTTDNRSTKNTTNNPGQVTTPENENSGCNNSANNIPEEQIREAINSKWWLRLLTNTSIGGNVGFGLSGGGDIAFAVDKNGDIYLLLTAGAGGGLGLEKDFTPDPYSIAAALSTNVLEDIDIVDSIDKRSGWGISVGGTASIFSAELRSSEPNDASYTFGFAKSGLDFHAHIIYTWAVKVGSIIEED